MDIKKLKKIFVLLIVTIVIIIAAILVVKNIDKLKKNDDNNEEENRYLYNFGETLDLEQTTTSDNTEYTTTDFPDLGIIDDVYDLDSVEYGDQSVSLDTDEGRVTVSAVWMNEGKAEYIVEPTFGKLKKFILKPSGIDVDYEEVTRKDVVSYINDLAGLGFSNVEFKEDNRKNDFYNYVATTEDGERRVILNYEKGFLEIQVF